MQSGVQLPRDDPLHGKAYNMVTEPFIDQGQAGKHKALKS